jgi:hypothetical protein
MMLSSDHGNCSAECDDEGGYFDDKPAHETLGRIESRKNVVLLRDAVVRYLKARGFAQARA